MERLATTPFGAAPMRADIFALQARTAHRQQSLRNGEGGNDTGATDKWQLLRALTEARRSLNLSDRSIALVEALASFHPGRTLDGSAPIIVFPSNAELSLRTRGMSPATLRRHLALLVKAGLILRRDSPNGKRYCRRDDDGQPSDAFGFDLAPLALAAAAIHAAADAARAAARAIERLRAEVTLHLRDIAKLIAVGMAEGRAGDWPGLAADLATLSGRLGRTTGQDTLSERRDALAILRQRTEQAYLDSLSDMEMSANDSTDERHIQNSKSDVISEISGQENQKAARPEGGFDRAPVVKAAGLTLQRFLTLCPQIASYARDGIASWRDALTTADLVRRMLGVSPDAWEKARAALGDQGATVTMAFILERADSIRAPGGYLRDLTRKAQSGRFSLAPMLKALETGDGGR